MRYLGVTIGIPLIVFSFNNIASPVTKALAFPVTVVAKTMRSSGVILGMGSRVATVVTISAFARNTKRYLRSSEGVGPPKVRRIFGR